MKRLSALMLCAAVSVTGCSTNQPGGGATDSLRTGATQLIASVKARSAGKQPFVQPTAAQIAELQVAALQVNLLERGGSDFLRRIATRNDNTPGTVEVWRGTDNSQLFLRNGILVGTRGIGGDVVSVDATQAVLAVSNVRSGGGERRYFLSPGTFEQSELTLRCDIENLGRQATQVVDRSFDTMYLRESCIGGAGDKVRITNEYWVQPNSGIVRRSRQWTGPFSGYFEFILLKN